MTIDGSPRASWAVIGLMTLLVCALPNHAQAQNTVMFFDSEPGDPVGGGVDQLVTPTEFEFSARVDSSRTLVTVEARRIGALDSWAVWFASASGLVLGPGVFENAGRYPNTNAAPGLWVSSRSGRCSQLAGRFQIHELEIDANGEITAFAADFEHHCEDASPALFGAVRYRSARPELTPFEGNYPVYSLQIDAAINGYVVAPGIDCGAERTDCSQSYSRNASITLDAVPLPGYMFLGWAGFDCIGRERATVTMTRRKFCTPVFHAAPSSPSPESPDYSQGAFVLDGYPGTPQRLGGGPLKQVSVEMPTGHPTGSTITAATSGASSVFFWINGPRDLFWALKFEAPPGEVLTPGSYAYAAASSMDQGRLPVLSLSSQVPLRCGPGGRFEIHEIVFAGDSLARFAADFELPCGSNPQSLVTGSIRYRSTRASLLPFGGAYPQYALEVVPTPGGYVRATGIECGDGGRTSCRQTYPSPTTVSLTAVPSPGYTFVDWVGSCSKGAGVAAVVVSHTVRCLAVFTPARGSTAAPDPVNAIETLFIDRTGGSTQEQRLWSGIDSSMHVGTTDAGSVVQVTFSSGASIHLRFENPGGRLAPGDYEQVAKTRVRPRLEVPNCPDARGRFRVYEVSFDASWRVLSFAADFEAFCSSGATYLVGAVRFNSSRAHLLPFGGEYPIYKLRIDPAVNGTVTSAGIICGPGASDCDHTYPAATTVTVQAIPASGFRFVGWSGACDGGATTALAVTWIHRCAAVFDAVGPGRGPVDPQTRRAALFIDSEAGDPVGNGRRHVWLDAAFSVQSFERRTARLQVSPPDEPPWTLMFRSPGAELTPGVYERDVSLSQGRDADFSVSNGNSCESPSTSVGRFIVYEIAFASATSGELTALAVDFEQRCAHGGRALVGSIRFNTSRSELRPFPPEPNLSAPNDFNADGRLDLIWQNRADGRLGVWFMAGARETDNAPIVPHQVSDANWHIVGTADANRDRRSDLYWQHQTTGALAVWYMNENARISAEPLSPGTVADTQWKIRTVADMDQDGWPDLIWQHTGTGALAVWFMNGQHLRSADNLSLARVVDVNWTIVGAGDVDRDGSPDLIWHHSTTGQLAVWFMRGRVFISAESLSPSRVVDVNWRVRGVGDLDGNGTPDLIWQNTSTLQVAAWLLNGLRSISAQVITGPALPNASWYIVGPR